MMRFALFILVIIAIIFGGAFVQMDVKPAPTQAKQQEFSQPTKFDHSNCQYPDRTTNPADGCDNSDPCDPAQTKGGSGDCLPGAEPANIPNDVYEGK